MNLDNFFLSGRVKGMEEKNVRSGQECQRGPVTKGAGGAQLAETGQDFVGHLDDPYDKRKDRKLSCQQYYAETGRNKPDAGGIGRCKL